MSKALSCLSIILVTDGNFLFQLTTNQAAEIMILITSKLWLTLIS